MSVTAIVYTSSGVDTYDDLTAARAAAGTTWVRATEVTDAELSAIGDAYGIHALEREDVHNNVRPKVEEFDDHTFLLAKTATLRSGETTFEEEIRDVPVAFFVGPDWVVTASTGSVAAVERVWTQVQREEPRLLGRGADFTAYRVLDGIVDDYFAVLDEIEDDIEFVEDAVLETPSPETLERINSLRRELLSVRRIVWPMRDAVGVVARGDSAFVAEQHEKYYRDVSDHLVQLAELVETYRDLVRGAREIYLNTLSQSTNEVMKRLTVVATIILPLTFVVGVYGMNFGDSPYNMPELGWRFGYPAVMLGMALVSVVLLWHFRREGWL